MEFLDRIRKERDFARGRRAEEKEIKNLKGYFNSPEGHKLLQETLLKCGIEKPRNERVMRIGRDNQAMFVAEVDKEKFLEVVGTRKPREIVYEQVLVRDEFSTGDFYIEIGNRIAIRTSGKIDDLSGAETLFSKLWGLFYRYKETPSYEQRWGKLVLENPEK